MKRIYGLGIVTLAVASMAAAQQALSLRINGKSIPAGAVVVKGTTYISADALKAAGVGVQYTRGGVELTLPTASTTTGAGGANQQNAVEGKGGEWLFNGIWRFQVMSVEKADPTTEGMGWKVKVEIRNGSKSGGVAPAGTGWQGVTLVLEDGNSIPARSDAPELRDSGLAQGAGNAQTLLFETESKSKPVRLILRFDPKGLAGTALRFSVPDPTFRVDVKAIVRPNCN
ncbi:hypothetical protein [Armatimonas sp.]|uniref:hypothetical protein n=1 Tax=Armatimonas sp. TaxID=1872638 RepID=UPI002869FBC4|nr:hypothetical protein [Armatimonas sp.]